MNIPGITDITPDEMAGMTLEQLEELRDLADSQAKEFQMQLESLEMAGGVSIAHATQFKGILPPQVVLESFTSQVTHTNYAVATESLKMAAKVAIGVGLAAALGGLVILMMKAGSKGGSSVNDAGAGKLKKLITIKDEMGKIVDEFEVPDDERGNRIAEQARQMWKDKLAKDKDANTAVERFKEAGLNNFTLFSLSKVTVGDSLSPWPLAEKMYSPVAADMEKEYNEFLVPAVNAAVAGDEDAAKKINALTINQWLGSSQASHMLKAVESLKSYAGDVGTHSDPLHQVQLYLSWGRDTHPPTPSDVKNFEDIIRYSDSNFKVVPPNLQKIADEADKVVKLAAKVEVQQKRLAGVKDVPKKFTDVVDSYVEVTKARARSFNLILDIVDLEITAFNKMVSVIGGGTVDNIKDKISELEKMASDDKYDEQVRTQFKGLIARLRKRMSEVK